MDIAGQSAPVSLVELAGQIPPLSRADLIAGFVPAPHFQGRSFENYSPNEDFPSQSAARDTLRQLVGEVTGGTTPMLRRLFGGGKIKPSNASKTPHLYLDGGFGVGKTHLLAALALTLGPQRAAFGTFVEYTALVGALGFAQSVTALSDFAVLCIDEFELDDPGDTLIMSRLIRELTAAGVRVVATSNTVPESLGEGRFAAQDFLREIQGLAAQFEVMRVDGPDYRQRDGVQTPTFLSDDDARLSAQAVSGVVAVDDLDALLGHLVEVHPSRYGALVKGLNHLVVTGMHSLDNDHSALRFVVLVDRLYDNDVSVTLGTTDPNQELFAPQLLRGGYRKKYFRTLSRLTALTEGPNPTVSATTSG